MQQPFFSLDPEQLAERCQAHGMPRYRAGQIMQWVYERHVSDPQAMSNLSRTDREAVARFVRFTCGQRVRHQQASDGTQKLLLQWEPEDAAALALLEDSSRQSECVMIPAQDNATRRTACISSQIGCPVGCRFCASGIGGLDGQLRADQIVEQVWQLATLPGVGRISHVVFMGMGEPLSNFEQVTRAITMLMAPWGLGISGRRITVSTVGLPAQIRRLAAMDLPITLAISLHAPNDTIRRQIIPWANFVSIEQLTEAGQHYFERTGREVTLEYILLGKLNDQAAHARELVGVARQLRSNVNLIRYNEVVGMPFERPSTQDVLAFQAILRKAGVNTHIRASRGRDIAAACGQLRHEAKKT